MATKVSMNSKDAQKGGLGFGEGWGIVVSAKSTIHQFPPSKSTGAQAAPTCKLVLELQHTDENGKSDGSDPVLEFLNASNADKQTGEFHTTPGQAKSRTDANAKDLGSEVGVEGNCFVGAVPYASSKFMTFTASLGARGYRQDILNEGYLTDLEGMVAFFVTEKRAAIRSGSEESNQLLVKEIKVYPYEKTAQPKLVNGTGAAKAGAASGPKPAATEKVVVKDPAEIALGILVALVEKNPGATVDLSKMRTKAFSLFAADKADKSVKDEAKKLIESPEWLSEVGADLGLEVGEESVVFPG